jgi:hypothetical protein
VDTLYYFSFYYGNKSFISIKYSTLDIQSHVPGAGILVGSAVERSTMGGRQSWVRAPLRSVFFSVFEFGREFFSFLYMCVHIFNDDLEVWKWRRGVNVHFYTFPFTFIAILCIQIKPRPHFSTSILPNMCC